MDKERIIVAGMRAHALAQDVAAILQRSDVPPAHWDEVLSRVAQIVADHVPAYADGMGGEGDQGQGGPAEA
jgi:hypothetical protein